MFIGRLPWLLAASFLLLGLATTVALTMWHAAQNEKLVTAAVLNEARELVDDMRARIDSYGHGLRGGRGIMIADDQLNAERFAAYAESRDLTKEFPGTTGMAFIRHIPRSRSGSEDMMRIEHVHPPKLQAMIAGFDLASLPSLQAAALLAVQRKELTLAYHPVSSITGQQARDLMLLLPIFKTDSRKYAYSTLIGWSALVLDMDRMFAGLSEHLFDFEVVDATAGMSAPYLIHASGRGLARPPEQRYQVVFGDRMWEVLIQPRENLAGQLMLASPALTASAGLVVSLLLSTVILLLGRSWQQAVEIGDRNVEKSAIIVLSPDGYVVFDADRNVKQVNPAFLRMTGYRREEVIGADEYLFSVYLARDCALQTPFVGIEAMRRMIEADARTKGHQADHENPVRIRLELAGPGKRVVELQLRIATSANVSQVLYMRDITHEIEVDHMKNEFLAHAAHELRTPMASIFGYSELLLLRDFDAETRKDMLTTIHKQSGWLIEIINELLDLARIEARQGKDYFIEPVQLGPLAEEVAAALQIDTGHWPLTIDFPPGLPSALADTGKLRQALVNVIGNARKYSPAGGAIDIRGVERRDPDAHLVGVAVADHGIGLSPEQAAKVGERFFRADKSGKVPGTGLGMAITKETVEQLGGSLVVTSTLGEGTTVTLWLPAALALALAPA